MSAHRLCVFGCTIRNRHQTDCPCGTDHDDQHPGHCKGCLPRQAIDGMHWCQRHWDRTLDALIDIPQHTLTIASATDGHVTQRTAGGDNTRRSTKVHQGSPSPAWDAADEILLWAHAWAEAVADMQQHAGPFTYTTAGIPTRNMTATVDYLRIHLEAIAAADFAVDFAAEAIGHAKRLEIMAGADLLEHRLKARCPSCNQFTLVRADGADRVDCRNRDCARVWSEAEYANLAHVAAS